MRTYVASLGASALFSYPAPEEPLGPRGRPDSFFGFRVPGLGFRV